MNAAKTTTTVPRLRFTQPDCTPFPDWEEQRLGDVIEFSRGTGVSKSDISQNGHTFCIAYGELFTTYNEVINSITSRTSVNTGTPSRVGDILMPASDVTPTGLGTASAIMVSGVRIGGDINILRPLDCINSIFLSYQINSRQKDILKLVTGTTIRHLYSSDIAKIKMALPRPDEQAKIAAFLGAVDARLEGLRRKHTHLTQYKRGIMQRLFSQALRFTQPDGTPFPDWEEKRLGDVFSERNEKGFSNLQLLAVTISTGVVKTSSLSRESNTPSNKESYKRLCIGDIAYNTMRMWQGASGVSAYEGIISPAYTVIVPNDRNVSEFWGQYFKCRPVIKIFERHSQGLVSDTWSIKYPALSSIKLFAPHPDEQAKIADFLSAIDRRIDLLDQQLTTTEGFKKFLLQQMFV